MKTYISQAGLARRIGCAPATLAKRLREQGVQPHGILIQEGKEDGFLFEVERLPQLRQTLGNTHPENITA